MIQNELKQLDKNIQDIIILNKEIDGPINNDFYKYIDNKVIYDLEMNMRNKCINEKSIYEDSEKLIINGYNCIKIKQNYNIYKSFNGFITYNQFNKYLNSNITKPSWFASKYVTYIRSRFTWGGIVSYKLKEDIILIDYFDNNNLEKIYNEILKIKDNRIKNFLKTELKYLTGYNISLKDQILHYYNKYKWDKIWLYDKVLYPNKFSHFYCNEDKIDDLNPVMKVKGTYLFDILLFDYVINKLNFIDGVIKKQIFSSLELCGLYNNEELLLKHHSQKNKIIYDNNNDLTWTNWKIKDLTNYKGIEISLPNSHFLYNTISNNYNFNLIHFINNNYQSYNNLNNDFIIKINNKLDYILSYNVHSFIHINKHQDYDKNFNDILNLLTINYNIKYLSLYEVSFKSKYYKQLFYNHLNKNNFNTIISCVNGSVDDKTFIIFASKNNIKNYKIINMNEIYDKIKIDEKILYLKEKISNIKRNNLVIELNNGIKICCLHLSIGIRYINLNYDKELEDLIIDTNYKFRLNELKSLINYKPNIIIGDFNFTIFDKENKYLIDNNYINYNKDNNNTTPFNRVDHCYFKYNDNIYKNDIIKCNYSDHLPILQPLYNI